MTPERFKRIEEIYHGVLKIPIEEREIFLRKSCENDSELRREVESLLSFETGFDSLIDSSPKSLAEEMFAEQKNSKIIGKNLNQYKILTLIGEGGMGEVFLAKDTKLERKVAVKLLSEGFAEDTMRRNRFFREAKSASALNHPNILTVHEIGETDGTHFIVTEYIKGRTLKKYLSEEKPPLQKVLEIAAQIASALSAAHQAGIIHRDIKPDNVMVRNDGIVKVLDFGIAKLNETNEEVDLEAETQITVWTQPGIIIGTPRYMSPEQARGQKVDLRSDIFSFGVVLYEMIAGEPPFSGSTNMDTLGSILKDEPKSLSEHLPEISTELEHIIDKALRKDREFRYQHIKDLYIDLNDAIKKIQPQAKSVHQTETSKPRKTVEATASLATAPRFSFIQVFLFLFVISGAVGGIYWWFSPGKSVTVADLKTVEVANWASSPGETYSVGAFSPDAKMVAFTSTKSGTKNIWVKNTASGDAIPVTKDEFENKNPVWSPTGEDIAFYSTRGNQAGIWRTPMFGGSPVLTATVADAGFLLKFWAKSNLIYYESRNDIYAVNTESGEIKQITDFKTKGINARSISLSRNEQKIAYITTENKIWSVWVKNLNEDTPKKLVESQTELRNTVWHPDGNKILFNSKADDSFQIFVTDIQATPPQKISSGESDNLVQDISADGTKILYGAAKEESDIWTINLKDNKEFTVVSDIDSELWANVSPNGKTIAYQSIKNLSQGNKLFSGTIFTKSLGDNQQPVKLVEDGYLPIWSPDGNRIAYMRMMSDKAQIETTQVPGVERKVLANQEIKIPTYSVLPYNRLQTSEFSWSPNSEKLAYISDKSGFNNIWLVNADGGNEVQLTDNQDSSILLYCPLWSADGKKIAYTTKTNTTGTVTYFLHIIDTETKISKLLTQQTKFFRLINWIANNELMLASIEGSSISLTTTEVTLLGLKIETGESRKISRLKDTYLYNIYLSPDTKQIAFAAHRDGKDNIWLMSSASGEEKQVTNNNDSKLYFSTLAWSSDNNSIFFGKQSRFSLLSMLTNFK